MQVIHEYVRERVTGKGKQIVGVIVGTVENGMIKVGWSKANIKMGDVFDKDEGIRIALDRANGLDTVPTLPGQMNDQYRQFQIRCLRYFKQGNFVHSANVDSWQNFDAISKLVSTLAGRMGIGIGLMGDGVELENWLAEVKG